MIGLIVASSPLGSGAPFRRTAFSLPFARKGLNLSLSALRFDFDAPTPSWSLQRSSRTEPIVRESGPPSVPIEHTGSAKSPLVLDIALDTGPSPKNGCAPPEAYASNLRPVVESSSQSCPRTRQGHRRQPTDGGPHGDGLSEDSGLPTLLSHRFPVAPLRSKPEAHLRSRSRRLTSPEGEHIPMLMMRLNRTDAEPLGLASRRSREPSAARPGCFRISEVKRHGKQMSDPFQLQVKVRTGPHASIVDVGYGVSQSLPILVDVMTAGEADRGGSRGRGTKGRSFLLQQPEVHLHPRGQAELANLFIEAFKKRGHRFLIETHSDYVVDRVRISVRKGSAEARRRLRSLLRTDWQRRHDPQPDAGRTRQPAGCAGGVPRLLRERDGQAAGIRRLTRLTEAATHVHHR